MKKMKKAVALGLSIVMATSGAQLTGLGAMKAEAATNISRVSVHDPSIFAKDGKYYVFGSHIATASSDDLVNWTQVSRDYQDVNGNVIYGNLRENLAESFKWAGYDDGDCAGGNYAVWAPDVIYNPDYVWEDGSKGAYMLYYSASSTWRRSCIGYMVSKNYDGGYQYGGTVVYSGFTNTGSVNYDGNSKRDTTYTNDYLPFNDLIADGVIDGDVSTWKCFNKDGSWNNNYAPNAIDPTLFYDATGEHLYMVYGSWSGGLFILEIDKTTGEAIYPGKDEVEETSGNYVDRYFGVHIAGGNHQSGEGPYIEYDKNTGYYYMYETYGGLTTTGGYNMRLFRSKNVYGPYIDPAGNEAGKSGVNCYKYGVKLIGNYQFYGQPGYRAAGHNSAMITDDGKYYLFYHQRFLDSSRGEGHEVRVRQQFLNEDDWLVTAVYENRNEQIQKYTKDDVVGSYEFVNHGNAEKDGSMISTESVTLNEDGTISGDETGSWTMADAADYTYVTLNIGDAVYKGVFFEQTNDNDEKTMTFTAIGNNNLAVWGSKFEESEELVVGKVIDQLAGMLPDTTRENISLPKTLSGAAITWKSDTPAVLSDEGVVSIPSVDTKVKLTATITCDAESRTEEYEILVYDNPHIIAGYDFENVDGANVSPTEASVVGKNATLMGTASVVKDEIRGEVLKVENSEGNKQVNYLSLPNDLFKNIDKSGYTVSMWVNVDASTWEHSALFEADMVSGGATTGNYPMTRIGANLIGRINANDYSDAVPGIAYGDLTGKWQLVTYTVDTNGIKVYLNGNQIVYDKKDISNCFSGKNAAIQNANHIMVGAGDIWSDEDCRNALFDDVRIYDTALTASEISSLYYATYMDDKEDEPKEPEHKVRPIAEEESDVEGMTKLYIRLEDEEFFEEANVYAVDADGNPVGFGEEPGKAMAHIGNGWYSVNVPDELLASEAEEEKTEQIENPEIEEALEEEIKEDKEEDSTEETILERAEEVLEELVDGIKSAFSPIEVKAAESNIFADGVTLSVNNGKGYSIADANSLFIKLRPSAEELKQEESEEPAEVPAEEPANSEPTPAPQPAAGNQTAQPVPSNQSSSSNQNSSSSSNSTSASVSVQPVSNNTVTTVAEAQVPLAGDTKIASNKTNKVTKTKTTKSTTDTTEEKLTEEVDSEEETEENDTVEKTEDALKASVESAKSVTEENIEDEEVAKAAIEEETNSNGFGILPIILILLIAFGGATTAYLLRKNK